MSLASALQGARHGGPPAARLPRALVAGATGTLGNEVLRRLAGGLRFDHVLVLAREPITTLTRAVRTLQVEGDIADWPVGAGEVGVVMFDPPRLFHDRERALWTPRPDQLPALARWMRASGAQTLAVVLPHDQGSLPAALGQGLAGMDEQQVAALGFTRVIFIRSARKPASLPAGAGRLERLAHWMLSITRFMVPASEQPPRASKVAELVDLALQLAPPGIHVAAPELVWRATQGPVRTAVEQWLLG